MKNGADPQNWGFFGANSKPEGVVIVKPSQEDPDSCYYIPRSAYLKWK